MESALYGIYALVVFVSENSCVNTVRAHFLYEVIYIYGIYYMRGTSYMQIPEELSTKPRHAFSGFLT